MRLKLSTGAVALVPLALTGCYPTMQMREGDDRDRLVEVVKRFCEAERSADPKDTGPLFAAPIRPMLERLPPAPGREAFSTSTDPRSKCEPGRTWYLGGSRMFAEVRLWDRSDRLDFWRGEAPLIRNVLYGRSRRVGAGKADDLREALMLEFGRLPAAAD
jgi:hypothetical protein